MFGLPNGRFSEPQISAVSARRLYASSTQCFCESRSNHPLFVIRHFVALLLPASRRFTAFGPFQRTRNFKIFSALALF
jgi:hypothetical protein